MRSGLLAVVEREWTVTSSGDVRRLSVRRVEAVPDEVWVALSSMGRLGLREGSRRRRLGSFMMGLFRKCVLFGCDLDEIDMMEFRCLCSL